jgi:hypothetical protein
MQDDLRAIFANFRLPQCDSIRITLPLLVIGRVPRSMLGETSAFQALLLVEFGGGLLRERGRIFSRHDQAAANAANPPAAEAGVQIQKQAISPRLMMILVRSTVKDTSPNPMAIMNRSEMSRERGSRRNTHNNRARKHNR